MELVKDFKLDFIGIGAAKSATSWIFECLKEHPQICASSKKEVHFFDTPYNYRKGLDYYYSFFKHCEVGKIKGEFSPGYLYRNKSAERIYNAFPGVRLIVCLRNPIERAYSHYKFSQQRGGSMSIYPSFSEAINRDAVLLGKGFYFEQLKRYFDLFPEKNIFVGLYDDLEKDPLKFIQRVYVFLGVDSSFVPSLANKRKGSTGSVERKAKLPFLNYFLQKTGYWARNNETFLYSLLDRVGIRKLRLKLLKVNQEKFFKEKCNNISSNSMEPKDRKKLWSIYKQDIGRLEQLLNKDLSAWKYYG